MPAAHGQYRIAAVRKIAHTLPAPQLTTDLHAVVHRYMAPEVALSKPYSHRAEVFAFGTLVWQMLAHERPFADCDVTTFYQRVCHRGERPKIPRDTPPQLAECVAYARTQQHFPLFFISSPRVLTCPSLPSNKQDPTAMLGGGTGAPPRALGRRAGAR